MRPTLAVLVAACLLASPATADVFMFQTPSGNVVCSGGVDTGDISDVMCEIIERNGPPAQPRPAGCSAAWGHHYSMPSRGPVEMACGGPRARGGRGVEVAPYGVTGRWGKISCRSEQTGLTCTNADGHGFFLSRARQAVF